MVPEKSVFREIRIYGKSLFALYDVNIGLLGDNLNGVVVIAIKKLVRVYEER